MRRRESEERDLYVGDFDGFVARRNELAKHLRADGDPDEADRVKALRKPSRVAWAINQVSAEKKQRDELLEAGAALRQAQEQLLGGKADGADLRKAGEREQAAVDMTLDAASAAARDAGAKLSPAAIERARQTLHAVALDEDVRGEFERQRLTAGHEQAGLGGVSLGATRPRRSTDQRGRASKKARGEFKAAEAKRTLFGSRTPKSVQDRRSS